MLATLPLPTKISIDPQKMIGIMQNISLDDTDYYYHKPAVTWRQGVAPGTLIIYPAERFISLLVPVKTNDSTAAVSPLYDRPGAGNDTIDQNSLRLPKGCHGGGKATTNDSPFRSSATLVLPYIENGVTIADITYSLKQITFKLDFTTWCVGYDQTTRIFYTLAEREWEMDMDSNKSAPANPQKPTIVAQHAVSIVPVRSPFSNDLANGILFRTEGPVSGSGTITSVRP